MQFNEIARICDQLGQLGVAREVYEGEWNFTEDPVCLRLDLCYNFLRKRLYDAYGKTQEFFEIHDWYGEVLLPTTEISVETFCHGILAEYFLQVQDFVCYKVWNERYENALADLRLKRGGNLPVGRWI